MIHIIQIIIYSIGTYYNNIYNLQVNFITKYGERFGCDLRSLLINVFGQCTFDCSW